MIIRRFLAVALGLVAVGLSMFPGPVAAQGVDDCRAVVDSSGLVDTDEVQAAVDAVDQAAIVLVRSYDTVPDGDLVATVDDLVASCFSDPETQAEVVVLGLSVGDRLSDVLIGSRWGASGLDPDVLRSEVMGSRFAEDDYTGGLVDAVNEVEAAVGDQLALEPDTGDEAAEEQAVTETTEDDNAGQSAGSLDDRVEDDVDALRRGPSGLAVAGGLAGIGACGGLFWLINRQRRLSAARTDFAEASAGPISRLGLLRERDHRMDGQVDIWATTTAGRTLAELRSLRRGVEEARGNADASAGLLTQSIPDGAENADRSQLERAQRHLLEMSRALEHHDEQLDRLAGFGAHIDHLRVALPAKAELLDEEVDEAVTLADQRRSEGWAIASHEEELNRIDQALGKVEFDDFALDLLSLSGQVEQLEADLFAVDHQLQSLPSKVGGLKQWSAGLETASDLEMRRIEELRRQLAAVVGVHAGDSWQWAADHPEQASEELDLAADLQDKAIGDFVSTQRFDEAGRQLEAAGLRLMAADALLDQLDDLLVDLEQAREQAPDIIRQCESVLASLTSYVEQHRSDLDDNIVAAPAALAVAVDGLTRELYQRKPNYLRVAETGDRISRRIDDMLAEAEDQHQRMEALRREFSREVARARRALARARRSVGWELFKSRDGAALDRLEDSLTALPDDPVEGIEAAADIADDALRIQERIIARRRRQSTWVATGGGGWQSGGGGWSGSSSGSSGGFGSRSSSGRSFSSSSSSGGRSFGGGRSSGSF